MQSFHNEIPINKNANAIVSQLVKALIAYRLGALPKVAGSNPGGSMKKYFHMYNGC